MSVSACSRRAVIVALPMLLGACASMPPPPQIAAPPPPVDPFEAARYGAKPGEPFEVQPVDLRKMNPKNLKQEVDFPTDQPPGTIVVDPHSRFLYLVQENGKALRYGVGVGKAGLEFQGSASIQMKREWPRWTPTPDMIGREPDRYAHWKAGMDGGAENPLGARALYLFKDGKDTLYRIHGTNEPQSIGKAVSSGCIRMLNQDVIDLYGRVPRGSKVVVL
ncbi:L,D-transpeptidase [Hansschlegelia zhihuaiae]|uniref:L,D-transpeptidase n=1 Tax=Hansschlegelia zhihuaiae TaxID=405005 RepID=UPI0013E8BCAB|nr:L,D-transpeptidase [Hansschlegelia zhihuaiae]